ncbi:AI-2E family transporter [Govanella unica]|uniref:AI-2E family transporter n=1 Tax=Govanella unica TaxID=2975056 RepID=A0A9X3TX63_9PROT|nr:AI-2E family transporter [Govania unica]MDA5193027.1 AI-2E family transporter [Govania unica]
MVSPRLMRLTFLIAGMVIGGAFLVWAGDILSPFIVALMLAYLCDPLTTRFEKFGIPRGVGSILVVALLVLLFLGALSVLGPIVYGQLQSLIKILPSLIDRVMDGIRTEIMPYIALPSAETGRPAGSGSLNFAAPLASSVLSGGLMVLPKIGLALLTPVILYYLLRDWPKLVTTIYASVPDGRRQKSHEIVAEVDHILSGFLRGQAWVCVTVAIVYASGLMLSGLEYGLVIGIFAGFMKYLPYIGTAIALVLAGMTGVAQEGATLALFGGVAATFIVAEGIESSILTPRLVGERVDVPPAMVIFAVLMGGKLLGVLGVFLGVPIFAILRLIVREVMAPDPVKLQD